MFKQAVIRRNPTITGDLDKGLLAETLLFYEDVFLFLDRGSLTNILQSIGPSVLLTLLDNYGVKASYLREGFGTASVNKNGILMHSFVQMRVQSAPGRQVSGKEELEEVIQRALSSSTPSSRKVIKKLVDKIAVHRLNDRESLGTSLVTLAYDDLKAIQRVQASVSEVLQTLLPPQAIPSKWVFEPIMFDGDGFVIHTDLDFEELNKAYHQRISPSHSSLSPALLVTHLFDNRVDAYFASKFMGDFVTSPISSALMKLRFTDLIRKRNADVQELDLFQDVHLEGRTLREAINSGDRTFDEFLKMLDKATRFKTWLSERNPDAQLLREYHQAATTGSWVDKLPSKGFRWAITTGLGLAVEHFYPSGIAAAASQGISALDAMALDKILQGWRPNHFVEGPLNEFVSK